jgi:DNA gyrase subunit A
MRLSSLTGLESNKLKEELESLESKIKEYNDILENESRILEIIKEETKELKTKYSTERKTHIITDIEDISTEDIIPNIPWLVMMTNNGYIKRMSLESYRIQNRGGVGISGGEMKDDDFPIELITASAHQNLLFFSSLGRVYCRKAYEIPEASRTSRGRALVNIFDLQPEETIRTIISISSFENQFLVLLTENGFIKKVELSELSHIKKNGIRIITLEEHDRLISVCITNGNMNLILATAQGRVCNFSEAEIRPTGRTSRGVMACTLKNDDKVVNMVAIEDKEDTLLSITKNGYAKRTKCSCFRQTKRKSMGVGNLRKIDITGPVVSTITVQNDNEEVMIITAQGMIIRTHAALRCINRLTKGIKFLRLKENDYVVTIMKLSCDVVEFLQNAQEFTENQDTIIEDSQENAEDAQEDSQDNAEDAQENAEDAQENVEEQSEDEELLDVPKDEFLNASDIVEDEQDNEAESNYNESMQEDEEHNEDDI